MRLGISSYTFAWAVGVPGYMPDRPMQATDLLRKAHELGVDVVQVADNLPLDRLSGPQLERFEQRARELGLSIEVGTRGIDRDHLLTYVALAERFGSPILRLVLDTPEQQPTEREIIATLRSLGPDLGRAGISVALENHDRFMARTLVHILEQVGHANVGICLDTANSFGALEGPEVVVKALGPWAINLHVKDFTIRRFSYRMGFIIEGCPAGQGRLDVPWLLRALHDLGRDPNAILELWSPRQETLAATIAQEERWAAESVAYLRKLIPRGGNMDRSSEHGR